MPGFRIQGKHFFLTYPRCDLPKEDLRTFLLSLYPEHGPHALVAREQHEDGSYHLHAAVTFERRIDCRDARRFDFLGHHPNLQRARSIQDVAEYISKDGDVTGSLPEGNETRGGWSDIIDSSTTRGEFLQAVRRSYPRDYVIHHSQLASFCDLQYPEDDQTYTHPEEFTFNLPLTLRTWQEQEFVKGDRPRALVLSGRTRTGKTTWARSLGPHLYYNGYFSLADFTSEKAYVIFDDVPWERMKNLYKYFFGAQKEFILCDKYMKKRRVRWGKPCIFLCNDDNDPFQLNVDGLDWISGNVVYYKLIPGQSLIQ